MYSKCPIYYKWEEEKEGDLIREWHDMEDQNISEPATPILLQGHYTIQHPGLTSAVGPVDYRNSTVKARANVCVRVSPI